MHRSKHRYTFDEDRSERGLAESYTPPPLPLQEARTSRAFVRLCGEYRGSTYLVAAAQEVLCSQEKLEEVLSALDQEDWNDYEHAGIDYVDAAEAAIRIKPYDQSIGMRDIWIARYLDHVADKVLAMIAVQPGRHA